MVNKNKNRGTTVVEIMVAVAVFAIIGGSLLVLIIEAFDTTRQARTRAEAESFAVEGIEAVRSIQRRSWNEIATGTHGLDDSSGYWELSGASNTRDIYTRQIIVEDVYRDSSGNIVDSASGDLDIWTKKVISRVAWEVSIGRLNRVILESYLYNWRSEDWIQGDWSGGSGQAIWSDETRYYADDGNVDVSVVSEIKLAERQAGGMEVGKINIDHNWYTVNLDNEYENPVIVAIPYESANTLPMSIRIRNASTTSFDIRLQNPSGSNLNTDDIYYIVVEEGQWQMSDGAKIEAHRYDTNTVGSSGSWSADSKTFDHAYDDPPVLLHQVMTYNDAGWITTWASADGDRLNPPDTNSFQIALQGAEATSSHGTETIGWIAIESGIDSVVEGVEYETRLTGDAVNGHDNGCDLFGYANTYSAAPYIIGSQTSMDGGNGGWLVTCSLSSTQVGFHIEEDQVGDTERNHISEDAAFVVFEEGFSTMLEKLDFKMEVGSLVADGNFQTVSLKNTYLNPVVAAFYLEDNNTLPASTRVRNVDSDSFEIRLHNPSNMALATDTAFYIVVESGKWYMPDGSMIEARVHNTNTVGSSGGVWAGDSVTYYHSFSAAPIVLHQVMSNNDASWISSWVSADGDVSNPPDASGFQVGLNGAEATTSHGAEDIGLVIIENNIVGNINNGLYETQVTTDSIQGHDDGCYTYAFNQSYDSFPFTVASQQKMDGVDGSWLAGCSLNSSDIGLHCEEDQVSDSERSHTTEIGAFVAFSKGIVYAGAVDSNDWPFNVSGNYTYDNNKIEVVGGSARLKTMSVSTTEETTNPGFDSDSAGWSYYDWSQDLFDPNATGSYVAGQGNPAGSINVNIPAAGLFGGAVGGFWEQPIAISGTTTTSAVVNFDGKVTLYDPTPTTFQVYAFVDNFSGAPTIGQQVWSSGEITGTTGWVSIGPIDVSSKITGPGTYYLKLAVWTQTGFLTFDGPYEVQFDNASLHWEGESDGYPADSPSITHNSSYSAGDLLAWTGFAETATKSPGSSEIYYQLSEDNGATWRYWDGSAWSSAGSSDYNTAAEVDKFIYDFPVSTEQIKFRAFLESDGSAQVSLDNLNISYRYETAAGSTGYVEQGELESSSFDTGGFSNFNIIAWEEDIPPGPSFGVKLQIKTAPDSGGSPGTWSATWCGPEGEDGDETDYFNTSSSGEYISSDHNGDRWIKYRAVLEGSGFLTPILDRIKINYQRQ